MARSTDPIKAARQSANLISGISPDPAVRAKQIAALVPGARLTHGRRAVRSWKRPAERHDRELAHDYPGLDHRRRALLADRLARIELASAFVAEHGIGPGTKVRRGEVWNVVDKLEQWSRAIGAHAGGRGGGAGGGAGRRDPGVDRLRARRVPRGDLVIRAGPPGPAPARGDDDLYPKQLGAVADPRRAGEHLRVQYRASKRQVHARCDGGRA